MAWNWITSANMLNNMPEFICYLTMLYQPKSLRNLKWLVRTKAAEFWTVLRNYCHVSSWTSQPRLLAVGPLFLSARHSQFFLSAIIERVVMIAYSEVRWICYAVSSCIGLDVEKCGIFESLCIHWGQRLKDDSIWIEATDVTSEQTCFYSQWEESV
jgi:hypothetical protein